MSSNISVVSFSDEPSAAVVELLAPDGYYTYLGVSKPSPAVASETTGEKKSSSTIDEEAIKKNYRKLSLRHHPDKQGGDADTFRLLNRAQKVLMDPKLREQYDILGIDLDDDEVGADHHEDNDDGAGKKESTSTTQGIVQEIAASIMTGIIQFGVRTIMMGVTSVFLVRYRWTLYPALAFLAYIVFNISQNYATTPGGSKMDVIPPALIGTGLILMHTAIGGLAESASTWNIQFWIGEAVVIAMFCYNSMHSVPKNAIVLTALAVFSLLSALWFRGSIWNYAVVIGFMFFLALFVAMAFPVLEILLEAILNEKLKKVGDKVRQHHRVLQKYYEEKEK